MRRDCDTASSVVIGFVILLMLIALGIGIWALISMPAEIKEAESTHAIELSNAFLDLKLSADKVRVNDFEGARFSMLMPGSSGMSGTTISFTKGTGKLHMYWDGGGGAPSPKEWSLDQISAQVGGTRGTTSIGYEGGGVFRSDNGNAVWLTPGLLEIYPDPDVSKTNNTVRVDLVVVNLTGEASVSSNWGVPLDCLYVGSEDDVTTAQNRTLTISLQEGQGDLWYSLFAEAKSRAETKYPDLNISITVTNEPNPQLEIGNGYDQWVKVYIREATYDVSLVSRYES